MSDRFHVTLCTGGRPAMQGWWADEVTARDKFTRWVGRGAADARVTLVDEETSAVLDEWPKET